MAPIALHDIPELVAAVRTQLVFSQKQLAALCEHDRRTAMRWERGATAPTPLNFQAMARAVYPSSRPLAVRLADAAGMTLVSMGLEAPAPPPAPAVPPGPPPPSPAHLVDSIVCVAAEAAGLTPQAIRPAVLAAFERAVALHMRAEAVVASLTTASRASSPSSSAPAAT